jgi:MtN3 and saliva related transmembrane protein
VTQLIGFAAAATGALAFLPQVIKTWRTQSSEDLSPGMLTALVTAALLWIVYGIRIRSWPVIAGNAVTLGLTTSLVVMRRRQHAAGHADVIRSSYRFWD